MILLHMLNLDPCSLDSEECHQCWGSTAHIECERSNRCVRLYQCGTAPHAQGIAAHYCQTPSPDVEDILLELKALRRRSSAGHIHRSRILFALSAIWFCSISFDIAASQTTVNEKSVCVFTVQGQLSFTTTLSKQLRTCHSVPNHDVRLLG